MTEPLIYLDWDGLMAASCPDCSALLALAAIEMDGGALAPVSIWRLMCPDDLSLVSTHALAKLRQSRGGDQ